MYRVHGQSSFLPMPLFLNDIKNNSRYKIILFSPFETTKAVWTNCLNGITKYGHTWDTQNLRYLSNEQSCCLKGKPRTCDGLGLACRNGY